MWPEVIDFVTQVCSERDISHDLEHMKIVASNAKIICDGLGITDHRTLMLVELVAWLHDVNDRKYPSTLDRLTKFLENLQVKYQQPETFTQDVLLMVGHIGWSKERQVFGDSPQDWSKVFNDPELILIRNIVSDADKLEALGKIGIDRCLQFGYHMNPEVTTRQSIQRVLDHAEDKLNFLVKYFTTEPGKVMAKIRHEETQMILEVFRTTLKYTV